MDSCPCDGLGPDDVHNFMDGAPDKCLQRFTKCQIARMHASFWEYRARSVAKPGFSESEFKALVVAVLGNRVRGGFISDFVVRIKRHVSGIL